MESRHKYTPIILSNELSDVEIAAIKLSLQNANGVLKGLFFIPKMRYTKSKTRTL